MKIKKLLLLALGFDLILIILFFHFQPLCEPCLDKKNCPLCLSNEQYFVIYFGICINFSWCIYYFFKNRSLKK